MGWNEVFIVLNREYKFWVDDILGKKIEDIKLIFYSNKLEEYNNKIYTVGQKYNCNNRIRG
jgi:hypothetical protein